jgi:hypothetical protein
VGRLVGECTVLESDEPSDGSLFANDRALRLTSHRSGLLRHHSGIVTSHSGIVPTDSGIVTSDSGQALKCWQRPAARGRHANSSARVRNYLTTTKSATFDSRLATVTGHEHAIVADFQL